MRVLGDFVRTLFCPYKSKEASRRRRGPYLPVPQAEGASGPGVVWEPIPHSPAIAGDGARVQVLVSEGIDSCTQPFVPVLVHGV